MRIWVVLALLLIAGLPLAPAAGEPGDAGSGRDSSASRQGAVRIGEGTWQASVGPTDVSEGYLFQPPLNAVVRVHIEGLVRPVVVLNDPFDRARDAVDVVGTVDVSAVGLPHGDWFLAIVEQGGDFRSTIPYTVTLTFEIHNGTAAVPFSAREALTVHANATAGSYARVDIFHDRLRSDIGDGAFLYAERTLAPGVDEAWTDFLKGSTGTTNRVIVKGPLRVGIPTSIFAVETGAYLHTFEGTAGFDTWVGSAAPGRLSLTAFIAWDGTAPQLDTPAASASFYRLSDLESPRIIIDSKSRSWAHDAELTREVAGMSNFVHVDMRVRSGLAPSRVTLTPPGGVAAVVDTVTYPLGTAPAGPWRLDVMHFDGRRDFDHVMMVASLPIPMS